MRKTLIYQTVQNIRAAARTFTGVAKTESCADKQSAEYGGKHFIALIVGKISKHIVCRNSNGYNRKQRFEHQPSAKKYKAYNNKRNVYNEVQNTLAQSREMSHGNAYSRCAARCYIVWSGKSLKAA